MNLRKIVFLDRERTIIFEPKDTEQVNGLEVLVIEKNVISSLKKLQNSGFELIVISNQDGLRTTENPQENYDLINKK